MPRRQSKRRLRHSGTLPFSTGQREIRFEPLEPSGTFEPLALTRGNPESLTGCAKRRCPHQSQILLLGAPAPPVCVEQASNPADLIGTSGQVPLNPQPTEYDGFYRLKADTGRGFPQPKGGRTAQKGSPPLPYTSLPTALRLHPCRALSSAEAGRSLYPAAARAQRRHTITAW